MADSPEGPRLSGLARSIDALFSAPSAPAPSPTPPATPAPTPVTNGLGEGPDDAAEPLADTIVEPPAEPSDDRPTPPEMFPMSQMLEAVSEPPPAWTEVGPASVERSGDDSDTLLSFESPWSEPGEPEPATLEPPTPEPASLEPLMPEPAALEPPAAADSSAPPSAAVAAEPETGQHAAPDADGFTAAVDAYLDGDRSARERVESLAGGLRERLALDPLADAVEKLVRAAGDPPDRTILALASSIMNPAVASRLVQRMGRERDETRRVEYQMLCRRLGLIMANGLKGALTGALDRGVRRVYYDTLISMGEVSRPVIEGMITDDNRFLVRDACVMLGELGGPRAVELVTSALADTDARVRAEALHALGELGDANAGSLTLGFLEDADSKVRLAAAVAAGKLGLERALRPLLQLLEDEEDADDRVRLLQALGDLGDPGAVPAIEKHAAPGLFAKASTDVRVAAYKALHEIGTPHARELVQRAANDKEPAVRAALRGLAREA